MLWHQVEMLAASPPRYLFQQLLLPRCGLQRSQLFEPGPQVGKLAAFGPLAHLSCCGEGGVEELGGACPGWQDEHALGLLGLVVVSQHAPEREQC